MRPGKTPKFFRLLHFAAAGFFLANIAIPPLPPASANSINRGAAYEIAEAYQLRGVKELVSGIAGEAVEKELKGKLAEWTIEACLDAKGRRKEEVKKILKEKIKKHLPRLAKKILYEKLFLGEFGDEAGEVKEMVDRITSELKISFNDRADQIIGPYYDQAIDQIDEYLRYQAGPLSLDLTNVRGTVGGAMRIENLEWGFFRGVSSLVGEATSNGIQKRFKDVMNGELPPELVGYLDMGPEKFASFASKVEDYLPGKKLDELKGKLLHTPLFILPNDIYAGILASSAAAHFAAAYKGVTIDLNELKRGVEVSRVLVWQVKNKEGLTVDLRMMLDAVRFLSDRLGISLDDLGKIGRNIKLAKDKLAGIEKKLDEIDRMIKDNLDKAGEMIKGKVEEIKGILEDFQNTLFKPVIDGYKAADAHIDKARKAVLKEIPKNFHGVPADWEAFKEQIGRKNGLFGKFGDNSPWTIMHKIAKEIGFIDAYEKIKKGVIDAGGKLNDKVSDALATAASEAIDAFGLTDPAARALGIENIPEKNDSSKNPLDPVILGNGEFYYQSIDLLVPGRGLHYEFKRTYRSRAAFKGVMGYGWAHNFEERLTFAGTAVYHIDGDGRRFAPTGVVQTGDAAAPYLLADTGGVKTYFNASGLMVRKEDRFGNRLEFEYDGYGRLKAVADPVGRRVEYIYNDEGLLASIRDSGGRSVEFRYDKERDLTAVTGPKTIDFPEGKTVRYGYTTGYYGEGALAHNLILIMDPAGEIYLKNGYGEGGLSFDRVTAQVYGDGNEMQIDYEFLMSPFMMKFVGKGMDTAANRVTVMDRRGIIHIFEHNANGNVLREVLIDERGISREKEKHVYNSAGLRVHSEYPDGVRLEREYDPAGNMLIAKIKSPEAGREIRYSYVSGTSLISEIADSDGSRVSWRYEGALPVSAEIYGKDGGLREYKYSYNGHGQRVQETDPSGRVTRYEYFEDSGYLKSIAAGDGPSKESRAFTYDGNGNIISAEDSGGGKTYYLVNELGQVLEEGMDHPFSARISYTFDINDNLTEVKLANSGGFNVSRIGGELVYKYAYDRMDRLIAKEEPVEAGHWARSEYGYDPEGRLIREALPEGRVATYAYDAFGRLENASGVDRGRWNALAADFTSDEVYGARDAAFDSRGNVVELADAAGWKTRLEYDGLGRRTAAIRQTGLNAWQRTGYEWDDAGRLVSMVSGAGEKTAYSYDALDRLAAVRYPDGGEASYMYDEGGGLAGIVMPDGTAINQRFDAAGRIVERAIGRASGCAGTTLQKFGYDGAGRLIYSFDNNDPDDAFDDAEAYYYYDDESNPVADIQGGHQVRRGFDADRNVTMVAYPSGGTLYHRRDPSGRLTGLFLDGTPVALYKFDGDLRSALHHTVQGGALHHTVQGGALHHTVQGGASEITLGNGVKIVQKYDGRERLLEQGFSGGGGGAEFDHYNYSYDARGKLAAKESMRAGRVEYEYDGMGRLAGTKGSESQGAEVDRNGNIVFDGGLRYAYDGFSRLSAVAGPDGNVLARYAYDVHNRRILKTIYNAGSGTPSATKIRYIYDGWNVIDEYDGERPLASYIYEDGIDRPVAYVDHKNGDAGYFYHRDYLGSVISISDGAGNVKEEYGYDPYGRGTTPRQARGAAATPVQPYLFASRYFDAETGLYYFRNRYYSPALRRFMTRDPLGQKIGRYHAGEAKTPFHISFHRRRNLATYPNNFQWALFGGLQLRNEGAAGIAGLNRLMFRPFAMGRFGEADYYEYAASDPVNGRDPFGLDYLWVTGEYIPHKGRGSSGRYADMQVIWIDEEEGASGPRDSVTLPAYDAVSGPWGKGPLPNGDYRGTNLRIRNDKEGMIIDGYGWSLALGEIGEFTDRSALMVHPDGNVFGSLGCIAITRDGGYREMYDRLDNYLNGEEKNTSIDVRVRVRKRGAAGPDMDGGADRLIRNHAGFLSSIEWR